ncbi:cysteine hydrolase family protein [Actinomadura roseirufa]|uniref:cysteine hydrolase family protein n=1 Tax=Actinomadura roseirufa TaxID=2094049 RepID=UPI0010416B39|nr:isochorismatase family cysteine hydrolase [Actinomadura roseirufa]
MIELFGKQVFDRLDEVLDPAHCAILSIDMQNDFLHPAGKVAQAGKDLSAMGDLVTSWKRFVAEARDLGVPVYHVRLVDLPHGASDSPAWLRSKRLIAGVDEFVVEGTWGAEFYAECGPVGAELVVTKHRSSGFTGTNLDLLLRSAGVRTVVIIGEQTPGCVEATLRDASYHDYYNVLVEDCVAAHDRRLHELTMEVLKARHDVVPVDEIVRIWARARAAA